jgi:hypothetical protein
MIPLEGIWVNIDIFGISFFLTRSLGSKEGPKSGYLPIHTLLISCTALILCMNLWFTARQLDSVAELHGYGTLHSND